jgi:hypothetical protein
MGITFPSYPETPLFPQWESPTNGPQPPVYGWHAFTSPNQRVSSSITTPRPLSDIPASVLAIIWYASPPGYAPERRTFDYGDSRPYIFHMPDGTTRTNSSNMSAQAYNNLVSNIWATVPYPE